MPIRKSTQKKVCFELAAPNAKSVALTGSFTSWDKKGLPMKKEKEGRWGTEVALKPGRHEYKYIVDGQWWTDPSNKCTVRTALGSENSVKEVTA